MVKLSATVACAFGALALLALSGCSSADTPEPSSGGTTSGGSTSSGGDTSSGGTTSTGGTTSGGSTGAGGSVNPAGCQGIKTGMACTPEGQACPNLVCGLADSGTRSCDCMTTWVCTACDFSASPFMTKPDPLPECTTQADALDCTGHLNEVCQYTGGEACACYTDDEGAQIWDCDKAPTTWM